MEIRETNSDHEMEKKIICKYSMYHMRVGIQFVSKIHMYV